MPTSATRRFTIAGLQQVYDNGLPLIIPVKLPASVSYLKGTILCEKKGKNEVVTLTEGTAMTAGTYTLTFGGQTTAALDYDATAAEVQAALEALSSIGTGNVSVTGGPISSAVMTITFQNDLGYQNVGAVTSDQTSLTGTFAIAVATAGVAATYGTWEQYAAGNTDGSQIGPCAILMYDCYTDSSGNMTLGQTSAGGVNGEYVPSVPAYASGNFRCSEVPDMTEALLTTFGGRMVHGTISGNGVFRLP